MFNKLNQYRLNLHQVLLKAPTIMTQYQFEWATDLNSIQQVQAFRAQQFSQQFAIQFESGLDQDIYDFHCEHAVLKEKSSGEIVAYTRLRCFDGMSLAQSYSQSEFQLLPELQHLQRIVELGRTCVHPRHRSGQALSILWLHLMPKILWQMRAQYLIGCVSVRYLGNEARAYYTHQYIQALATKQCLNIAAQTAFEPVCPSYSFNQDEKVPKLFLAYLNMQAKFSKQAYYDRDFNCLDYLVLLEVNEIAKKFVLQKKMRH